MRQRFIDVNGIRMAYLEENEKQAHTIFFIHGNSTSSRSWKAQLNSELFKDFRLIAIDLPGHGNSNATVNPAEDYSIPSLGAITAAAIKRLAGSPSYVMVGILLGTNILAESLAFDIQPKGIVLAGSCLIGGKYTLTDFAYPNTNVHVVFTEESPEAEVRKYVSQVMSSQSEKDIEEFIEDYYKVKSPFRSSLFNSIQKQQFNDQIKLIATINKPLLIVFGKDEQLINPDYLDDAPFKLWNEHIYKLPGASHFVHLDQSKSFNQLLAEYVADVF